jgi:histidinol-phosphate aminotransferase
MKFRKHLNDVERMRGPHPAPGSIRLASAERDSSFDKCMYKKFIGSLCDTDIRYYPNIDYAMSLLSDFTGVPVNHLTIGHGSDHIIKNVFECFVLEGTNIVTTDPCFPMYKVYASVMNAEVKAAGYKNKNVDIDEMIDLIDDNTSLVIFSNPCSPIGDIIYTEDIERLVEKARLCGCVVLIDEAYQEFSATISWTKKYTQFGNVIVTKTFSKAVGAAGLRFGYGVSNEVNLNLLSKVKSMYEITGPTIKWMETVIENWSDVQNYIDNVRMNKYTVTRELEKQGYEVVPSYCNWVHTTKVEYHESINTKQCKLPWDDRIWTRLCIPSRQETVGLILE